MSVIYKSLLLLLIIFTGSLNAQQQIGASIPWTTFETEAMKTNGTVLGPRYEPFYAETESSGQQCVRLDNNDQYVEFESTVEANSMVIRYSLPDAEEGGGLSGNLKISKNGKSFGEFEISSENTMLYGIYPFTNSPKDGKPRNFYNEIRIVDFDISEGDLITIQRDNRKEDGSDFVILDLIDLEKIEPALEADANSLSITDKAFAKKNTKDYTEAVKKCIAKAAETGKSVWIPPGRFKITGDVIVPSNVSIQGAGMWYSQLVGDAALYSNADKRVRIKGNGDNIHLSDFAIIGSLNYRNDTEANDGIVGSFGKNSTISRIWIEHTKIGVWVENSDNLIVSDCRFRNTIADGLNFCVGMVNSTVRNSTARGTGDDCFAMWPAVFMPQKNAPGHNLIESCTSQLPFLANGVAIYGGEGNQVKNCLFSDISPGSAILISTTFPTSDEAKDLNNNFSGTTLIENCSIKTSGGFDHTWGWRAALQICLDKQSISGLEIRDMTIENSFSDAFNVIALENSDEINTLTHAVIKNIEITGSRLASQNGEDLWYPTEEYSSLISKSKLILRFSMD